MFAFLAIVVPTSLFVLGSIASLVLAAYLLGGLLGSSPEYVFTNGRKFYPAALQAIRGAQRSICLEAYIFHKSEIGRMYVEALAERARAGVEINLTLDAFGSINARDAFFLPLLDAGGRVRRYNGFTWYRILHSTIAPTANF